MIIKNNQLEVIYDVYFGLLQLQVIQLCNHLAFSLFETETNTVSLVAASRLLI